MNTNLIKGIFFLLFRLYPPSSSVLQCCRRWIQTLVVKEKKKKKPALYKEPTMKAAIRSTTMKQLTANKAGEWEVKQTVFLFVACLHNPYSLSSRSVDEKLSSTLCGKPVFFFEAQHSGPTCTQVFHFHWAGPVKHLRVKSKVKMWVPGETNRWNIALLSVGELAVAQRHSMHWLSSQLKPKTMNGVECYTMKGLHRLRYQKGCKLSISITVKFRCKPRVSKMSATEKTALSSFEATLCFCEGLITPRGERTLPTHGACNPLIHPCWSYEVCTQTVVICGKVEFGRSSWELKALNIHKESWQGASCVLFTRLYRIMIRKTRSSDKIENNVAS